MQHSKPLPLSRFPFILLAVLGCVHRVPPPQAQQVSPSQDLTATLTPHSEDSTPVPNPSHEPKPSATRPLTVAFVGDIMLGGSALPKLRHEGPASFFVNVKDLLAGADLRVGNLEGPLGTEGKVWLKKKYTFLIPPEAADGLKAAGMDILTLANNHMMDYGTVALDSTLSALEARGLSHAGAGSDEQEARRPAWAEVDGRKIAVLAYSLTYPTEFWAGETRAGCAQADGPSMKQDVAEARASGADLVFVCIHWGREGSTALRGYQPMLSRTLLESGADAVVGAHPHIWQPLGVVAGKPVAYSIGNFVFGSYSAKVTRSGILFLTFDEKNRWTGGRIIPLDVHNGSVHFAPRPLHGAEGRAFFDHLAGLSRPYGAKLEWKDDAIEWIAPGVSGGVSASQK